MSDTPALIEFTDLPGEGDALRPDEDKILSGNPAQRVWNLYSDPSGQFFSGVWACEPGSWQVSYSEHEYCRILSGRVVLTDAAGRARSFGPGDAFVIPAGFSGTWTTVEPCRKQYVIFEATAA